MKLHWIAAMVAASQVLLSVCWAQSVSSGTFEIAGTTGAVVNYRAERPGRGGTAAGRDRSLSMVAFGVEVTYYVTPRFGIGPTATYQRVAVDRPELDGPVDVSGARYGLIATFRVPLDDRSTFVLVGSSGGLRLAGLDQAPDAPVDGRSTAYGVYWLAGGGLSFSAGARLSVNVGLRYQSSTFSAPGPSGARATAAGILASAGLSLYLP